MRAWNYAEFNLPDNTENVICIRPQRATIQIDTKKLNNYVSTRQWVATVAVTRYAIGETRKSVGKKPIDTRVWAHTRRSQQHLRNQLLTKES